MRFVELALRGAFLVELERHEDERGFFARTFCEREFGAHGLATRFPQANLSWNRAAFTLRGMHYQLAPHGEAKLVRCVQGAIHDVIVDLREGSPTRLRSVGVELDAERGAALYVPEGFAHGFLTLRAECAVYYHMGAPHAPEAARGFRWDDEHFAIRWPDAPRVVSERDRSYPPWPSEAAGD